MSLVFNIIYTPGTVQYLSGFVWSLLRESDYSFRLVSNGCPPPERRYLEGLCSRNPRLEYWAVPGQGVLPHGQALNHLHALTRGDHFCFMDSDIFASGAFAAGVEPRGQSTAGSFSGAPVWVRPAEQVLPQSYQLMSGTFSRTDGGVCLGSTYCALYDNRALTDLMQATGIGFENYLWRDIPAPIQAALADMGLQKRAYDTAKVLNLLLWSQDQGLVYRESPALHHLGGFSFHAEPPPGLKARVAGWLAAGAFKPLHGALQKRRARNAYKKIWPWMADAEFAATVRQRQQQRDPARQYFARLLRALCQGQPPPPLPQIEDGLIAQRIAAVAEELARIWVASTGGTADIKDKGDYLQHRGDRTPH